MSNEKEKIDRYIKQRRQEAEKREKEKVPFREKAKEMGLKNYPSTYSGMWVDEDYQAGTLPERFFVERETERGDLELEERRISFPVKNFEELLKTIDSLDHFYRASAGSDISYLRHGVEGFTDFLREIEKNEASKKDK